MIVQRMNVSFNPLRLPQQAMVDQVRRQLCGTFGPVAAAAAALGARSLAEDGPGGLFGEPPGAEALAAVGAGHR
jgi:hypothetical protein